MYIDTCLSKSTSSFTLQIATSKSGSNLTTIDKKLFRKPPDLTKYTKFDNNKKNQNRQNILDLETPESTKYTRFDKTRIDKIYLIL